MAQALRLRRWALDVAAGVAAGPPPAASAAAWRCLLAAERCAAPLRNRLAARGIPLPADAAAALDERATRELKRFLSVSAQLRLAGTLLRELGMVGVALKGGAAAADGGEPLDVVDLDLLVPAERAAEFAAALERRGGHRPLKADPDGTATGKWEMAGRVAPGGVLVEVHFGVPHLGPGVDPWARVRPSAVAGVHRLGAADHLWHLLVHSTVHHVERRGQLRELLLLADALRGASADDERTVEARAAAHRAGDAMAASLGMARALVQGSAPPDPFAGVAAARYALAAWPRPALPAPTARAFGAAAVALAAGGGEYARLWRGADHSAVAPLAFRGARVLDRAAPSAAWLLRTAWRSAHLAAATLPALRLHLAARRAARSQP